MKTKEKAKAKTNKKAELPMTTILACSKGAMTIVEVEGNGLLIEKCLRAIVVSLCEDIKTRAMVHSVCKDTIETIKKGECKK